jgi:hypothetical protein
VHSVVLAVHWAEYLLLKGLCKLTIACPTVATAQAQEISSKGKKHFYLNQHNNYHSRCLNHG